MCRRDEGSFTYVKYSSAKILTITSRLSRTDDAIGNQTIIFTLERTLHSFRKRTASAKKTTPNRVGLPPHYGIFVMNFKRRGTRCRNTVKHIYAIVGEENFTFKNSISYLFLWRRLRRFASTLMCSRYTFDVAVKSLHFLGYDAARRNTNRSNKIKSENIKYCCIHADAVKTKKWKWEKFP
jgi:hypothetical protein